MEELPEYQICLKCGKRSTPYMEQCWNCGESFYPYLNNNANSKPKENITDKEEKPEFVPEKISPCKLEEMNFTDRMFAYSLLFKGEMVLEFCECETCNKAFKEIIAFFRESSTDDEKVIKEAEETEIKGFILDISEFGL